MHHITITHITHHITHMTRCHASNHITHMTHHHAHHASRHAHHITHMTHHHAHHASHHAHDAVSFLLAGAALRGPGPLPRARSGRAKRWQARHRCRLCWQARYLEALDPCRARARGARNAGRRDTRVVCAGRRGTYRGPGPLPSARSGRAKRWQARHRRRFCWQARYSGALDRCRARARGAGNAGRRDTGVVSAVAGAALRGPGPLPRARSGRAKRWQARRRCRLCWQARYLEALDPCRARARGARNAGRRDTRVVCAGRRGT